MMVSIVVFPHSKCAYSADISSVPVCAAAVFTPLSKDIVKKKEQAACIVADCCSVMVTCFSGAGSLVACAVCCP